jgi:hypothetical protein
MTFEKTTLIDEQKVRFTIELEDIERLKLPVGYEGLLSKASSDLLFSDRLKALATIASFLELEEHRQKGGK